MSSTAQLDTMTGGVSVKILHEDERGVRVQLPNGRSRTVKREKLRFPNETKALTGAEHYEPITSSAEISGVLPGAPDGPVARALARVSEPAAHKASRLRQRQPPLENEKYLAWVRAMPCCHCGSRDRVQAHHWSHEGGIGGDKPDDYRTVPLCFSCHYEWWHAHTHLSGLDPVASMAKFVAVQLELVSEWLTLQAEKRPENVLDVLVGALRELDHST